MLEIKDLSIKVGNKYLIKNLSLSLNVKDKMAIIGEEGNGKSTLLKAILGICNYAEVDGSVVTNGHRIGYLEQSMGKMYLHKKVYDFLFRDENDYYEKINSLYQNLDQLYLSDQILGQNMEMLSGGEKVKVRLLKLLIDDYDILFLDEPTNDLDIETLEWLEHFINHIKKPIIYISHDETLLTNTANMILHIEQIKKKTECRHTLLRIDYETYVNRRLQKIEKEMQVAKGERRELFHQQQKLQRVMQKVEYQQNIISRKDPHGAKMLKVKMRSLKSQERRLDQLELTEVPDVEEHISFFFEEVKVPRIKHIISINMKEFKVADRILASDISLDVIGNVHLCIIGKNGVGKSTLIKYFYEELKNRSDIKLGYMPQNYDDVLEQYEMVLDFVAPSGTKESLTKARMYLGNMNFTREEMLGRIKDLSNGTKAKLFLIKLVLDECSVLLLDEPTRNVSPLSNPVIRKVLKDYSGTIISVSHDRKYIDEAIDSLYVLTEEGLIKKR